MKIFTKLTSIALLAGASLSANAQNLGEGVVVNPYPPTQYQTFLATVTLAYNYEMITLADKDMMVLVNMGGKYYEVYADVYFDPELAWDMGQVLEDPAWGNELVIDFSDEAFEAGYPVGPYTIEIPEGLVKNENGDTNPDQTIVFTKVKVVSPSGVVPAEGMYPGSELKKVTITFDEEISKIPESEKISLREKNDWLAKPYYIEKYEIGADGKTLSFELANLSRGKWYSVTVPEGFVRIGEYGINSEITRDYMSWDGMDFGTILQAPAHLTSQADMKPFIITWDYQPITIPAKAPDTEFVCGFPDFGMQDGWRTYIPASYYELIHIDKAGNITEQPTADKPANAVRLDVAEFTEDDSGYQFEIFFPVGLVVNEQGLDNPPMSYVFEVKDLWPEPQISANAGIINMEWPDAEWVTYNLDTPDATLTALEGGKYNLAYTWGHTEPGQISLVNEGGHGLEIDINGMELPDGNYTLKIPNGYLFVDGKYGEGVMNGDVTYYFGWINGEFTEYAKVESLVFDGRYIVYDLMGRKVLEGNDLIGLEKGIYIINGKKIAITK